MEEEDQREERDYLLSLYIHTPTTPTPRCLYSVAHHTHTLPLDTHPHHLPDLVFWHSCVVIHLLSTSHAHVCDRNLAACGARALGSVRGRARAARRCGFGPSARCPGGRPRRGCGTGRQQEILSVIRDAAYRGGITLSCICSPHHDAPGAACFPAPPGARAPAFRSVARVRSSTSPSAAPSRPLGPSPACLLPSPFLRALPCPRPSPSALAPSAFGRRSHAGPFARGAFAFADSCGCALALAPWPPWPGPRADALLARRPHSPAPSRGASDRGAIASRVRHR